MNSTFLSKEEVSTLTGLTQPAAQVRWLRSRAWLFETSASGRPQIARSYLISRMVHPSAIVSTSVMEPEKPDMNALLARINRHNLTTSVR